MSRRARLAAVVAVLVVAGVVAVVAVVAAYADTTAPPGPDGLKPLTGWSWVNVDRADGERTRYHYRLVQVDDKCFFQSVSGTGAGEVRLMPVNCP